MVGSDVEMGAEGRCYESAKDIMMQMRIKISEHDEALTKQKMDRDMEAAEARTGCILSPTRAHTGGVVST